MFLYSHLWPLGLPVMHLLPLLRRVLGTTLEENEGGPVARDHVRVQALKNRLRIERARERDHTNTHPPMRARRDRPQGETSIDTRTETEMDSSL